MFEKTKTKSKKRPGIVTLKNTPLNSSNNSENQGFENINNLDGSVDYRNEEVEQA